MNMRGLGALAQLTEGDLELLRRIARDEVRQTPSFPIGFVPGITSPIGEPLLVPFTIVMASEGTTTESQPLSSEVGFLWQEISIDSTGEFEFKLKVTGYDDITLDGTKIHSNTFSGEGAKTDLVHGHKLPTLQYMPGGAKISIEATDLSVASNTARVTLAGARVRPGSQFEADLRAAFAYNGLG